MKHIKTVQIVETDNLTEQGIMDSISKDWDMFDELHVYTPKSEIEKFSSEIDRKYCILTSSSPVTVHTYKCLGKIVLLFDDTTLEYL